VIRITTRRDFGYGAERVPGRESHNPNYFYDWVKNNSRAFHFPSSLLERNYVLKRIMTWSREWKMNISIAL
jgi:hypothetical protein